VALEHSPLGRAGPGKEIRAFRSHAFRNVFFLCLLFVIGMLRCAYRRYKYKVIYEDLNLVAFVFDVSASQCIS
jgi:hypothetical protein